MGAHQTRAGSALAKAPLLPNLLPFLWPREGRFIRCGRREPSVIPSSGRGKERRGGGGSVTRSIARALAPNLSQMLTFPTIPLGLSRSRPTSRSLWIVTSVGRTAYLPGSFYVKGRGKQNGKQRRSNVSRTAKCMRVRVPPPPLRFHLPLVPNNVLVRRSEHPGKVWAFLLSN